MAEDRYNIEKEFEYTPYLSGSNYNTNTSMDTFEGNVQRLLSVIGMPADVPVVLKTASHPERMGVDGEFEIDNKKINVYGVGKARNLTEDLYETVAHEGFHATAFAAKKERNLDLQMRDDLRAKGIPDSVANKELEKMIQTAGEVGFPSMNAWANGHEMMATIYANRAAKIAGVPIASSTQRKVDKVIDSSPVIKDWLNSDLANFPYTQRATEWSNWQHPVMALKQYVRSKLGK